MWKNNPKNSTRQINKNRKRVQKLQAIVKEFQERVNNELSEQNRELQQVINETLDRLKTVEMGTDIYSQLVIANDDRLNYLEEQVNQLENQNLNLKKRLIAVEYSSLFLGSILAFSGIIKLCYWLLTKPKKTEVERNKKGQFTKLKN